MSDSPEAVARPWRGRRMATPVVWIGRRIGQAARGVGRLVHGRRSRRLRGHTSLACLSAGLLEEADNQPSTSESSGSTWTPWAALPVPWAQQANSSGVASTSQALPAPFQQLLALLCPAANPSQHSAADANASYSPRYGAMLLPTSAFPLQMLPLAGTTGPASSTSSSTQGQCPLECRSSTEEAAAAGLGSGGEAGAAQQLLTVGSRMWGNWWDGRGLLRVRIYDFALYVDVEQVRQQLPAEPSAPRPLNRKQRRWLLRKQKAAALAPPPPSLQLPAPVKGEGEETSSANNNNTTSSSSSEGVATGQQFTLWPLLLGPLTGVAAAPTPRQHHHQHQQQQQQQQVPPLDGKAAKAAARYERRVVQLQNKLLNLHPDALTTIQSTSSSSQQQQGVAALTPAPAAPAAVAGGGGGGGGAPVVVVAAMPAELRGRRLRRYQRALQQLRQLHNQHPSWHHHHHQQQQQQQQQQLGPVTDHHHHQQQQQQQLGAVTDHHHHQQQQLVVPWVMQGSSSSSAPARRLRTPAAAAAVVEGMEVEGAAAAGGSQLAALRGARGVGTSLVLRAARDVPLHLLAAEYEKVLARRLERVGGDPSDPALAALLDTFRHPERLPEGVRAGAGSVRAGAAITFERGPGDVLLARVGGQVLGAVPAAGKVCEALLDLYLGEQPVSTKAKSAAALTLQRMASSTTTTSSSSRAGGPPYYNPSSGGGGRITCPNSSSSKGGGPLDLDACVVQLA